MDFDSFEDLIINWATLTEHLRTRPITAPNNEPIIIRDFRVPTVVSRQHGERGLISRRTISEEAITTTPRGTLYALPEEFVGARVIGNLNCPRARWESFYYPGAFLLVDRKRLAYNPEALTASQACRLAEALFETRQWDLTEMLASGWRPSLTTFLSFLGTQAAPLPPYDLNPLLSKYFGAGYASALAKLK